MAQHQTDIREIILERIATILAREYRDPVTELSEDILTAKMAFKADPQLNELRLALERLNRGEYGRCILCKGEIDGVALEQNPTAHFCHRCAGAMHSRLQSAGDHPERTVTSERNSSSPLTNSTSIRG